MALTPANDRAFFGHPRALSTLFFTEMWERFSYYGMRALLLLYMTAPLSVKTPDADFAEILSGKTPALWHSNAPAKGGDTGAMFKKIIERAMSMKAAPEGKAVKGKATKGTKKETTKSTKAKTQKPKAKAQASVRKKNS